jgi:hypothetical protein
MNRRNIADHPVGLSDPISIVINPPIFGLATTPIGWNQRKAGMGQGAAMSAADNILRRKGSYPYPDDAKVVLAGQLSFLKAGRQIRTGSYRRRPIGTDGGRVPTSPRGQCGKAPCSAARH